MNSTFFFSFCDFLLYLFKDKEYLHIRTVCPQPSGLGLRNIAVLMYLGLIMICSGSIRNCRNKDYAFTRALNKYILKSGAVAVAQRAGELNFS